MPLKPSSPANILILRFSSLGDVTLATGVAPALKARYPGAAVTFLTKKPYDELLALAPGLDHVLTLEPGESPWTLARRLKERHFDLVVDLHGSLRSRLLCLFLGKIPRVRIDNNRRERQALVWFKHKSRPGLRTVLERYAETLRSVDPGLTAPSPKLTAKSDARSPAQPRIGFCPGARHATKRWTGPAVQRCVEGLLSATKGSVILVGSEETAENSGVASHPRVINLTGKTSLTELAAVLASCSALVTVDSGPLHIAEALGIPVIALFGPTVTEFGFAPWGPRSRVVELPMECRPCSLHGSSRCPLGHHRCLRDIAPERVVRETLSVLNAGQ